MEEFDFYPPKPELAEQKPKGGLSITIFSITLFVLAFVLFFEGSLNFVLFLIVVLLIHELGHFLLMKFFGYRNVRMLFVPFMGAFVHGKKEKYRQKQSFMVIMAGPFPGILIGTALLFAGTAWQLSELVSLGLLFLFINMLNLIPLDPLDGSQLLKLLIRGNQELFQLILSFISSLLMIGLGWYFDSWITIVFGFLLGFRVRSLQKSHQMHRDLSENEVNFVKPYKRLTNREFSKIKEVVLNHTPALRMFIDQASSEESDPILASQVNNLLVAPLNRDASVFFRIVVVLLWIAALVLPVWLFFNLDLQWYFDEI